MASQVVSLWPTSSVNVTGPVFTKVGAGTFAACTNTNVIGKYVQAPAGSDLTSYENVQFDTFSLPDGARIEKVVINLMQSSDSAGNYFWAPFFGCVTTDGLSAGLAGDLGNPSGLAVDGAPHTVVEPDITGLIRQDNGITYPLEQFPLSGAFTVAIKCHFTVPAGILRLYGIRVDVYYNSPPSTGTVTVTNGATSSTPTIGWTYTDVNSDPQEGYQIIVVPAGAEDINGRLAGDPDFDPQNLVNFSYGGGQAINSGEVLLPGNSYTPPSFYGLEPGGSYIAYVRVFQLFFHGPFASAWSMSAWWTLTSTPPTSPSVAAAAYTTPDQRALVRMQLASFLTYGGIAQFERSYSTVVDEVPYGIGTGIIDPSGFTITSSVNQFVNLASGNNLATWMNAQAFRTFGLRMKIAPVGWTAGKPPAKQVVYHETTTGFVNAWQFYVDAAGKLGVDYARSGGTSTLLAPTALPTTIDYVLNQIWVRVDVNLNATGTSSFFYSLDGVTWVSLGTTVTATGGTGVFALSTFGGNRTGASTSSSDFTGRIYDIEIWNNYLGAGAPPVRVGSYDKVTTVLGITPRSFLVVTSGGTYHNNLNTVNSVFDFVDFIDYLAPFNTPITYSGRLTDTNGVGTSRTAWLAAAPVTVVVAVGTWWLKVPSRHSLDMDVDIDPAGLARQIIKATAQYNPLGRNFQVQVSDGTKHRNGNLVVQLTSIADYNTLRALYDADLPVSFQGTYGLYVSPVYYDLSDWSESPQENSTLTYWTVTMKVTERDPVTI